MNVKLDPFTIIVGGAIVLAAAKLISGDRTNPPTPAGSTAPPTGDYLVAPINDDEYSNVLDDELFDGIIA